MNTIHAYFSTDEIKKIIMKINVATNHTSPTESRVISTRFLTVCIFGFTASTVLGVKISSTEIL